MAVVGGERACYSEVNQLMIISDNFCNSNSRNWGGREWGEWGTTVPHPHSTAVALTSIGRLQTR